MVSVGGVGGVGGVMLRIIICLASPSSVLSLFAQEVDASHLDYFCAGGTRKKPDTTRHLFTTDLKAPESRMINCQYV